MMLLQVDNVFGGMLKSSKQQMDRGDCVWTDKFTVMLSPHPAQYGSNHIRFTRGLVFCFASDCRCRYTQHQHVTFKLREVVKPYKKIIGFAAVSLQAAAAACEKGKATAFLVPLRLQGLVCGKCARPLGMRRSVLVLRFAYGVLVRCAFAAVVARKGWALMRARVCRLVAGPYEVDEDVKRCSFRTGKSRIILILSVGGRWKCVAWVMLAAI
jgi:hypothetical protein